MFDKAGALIGLPEIFLGLQDLLLQVSDLRDQVFIAYSIANGLQKVERESPAVQQTYQLQVYYNNSASAVYDGVFLEMNRYTRQPLSLSLDIDTQSQSSQTQVSWRPDWSEGPVDRAIRLLLNHPSSVFSASRRAYTQETGLEEYFSIEGIIIDSVWKTSEYMPLRNSNDHYAVSGDNSTMFGMISQKSSPAEVRPVRTFYLTLQIRSRLGAVVMYGKT